MNHRSTPVDEPDDDDLAFLFKAQSTMQSGSPPAELDELILSAAKAAADSDTNAATSTRNVSRFAPQEQHKRATLHKRVTGWFAVAATVIIGVSVAPVLLKAPESSLDYQQSSAEDQLATESGVESLASAPLVTRATESASPASAEISAAAKALKSERSNSMQPVETLSDMAEADDRAQEQNSGGAAGENPDYRNTAESWIAEIMKLLDTEKTETAREEYTLFRKRHPNVEVDSRLDELELSGQ